MSAWKMLLASALILMFCFLILTSFRSGVDDVLKFRINTSIDALLLSGTSQVSLEDFQKVELLIIKSLIDDPEDPDLNYELGRLYDDVASLLLGSDHDLSMSRHKALEAYRKVTQQRPAWPSGYQNLANSKARLGQIDKEFQYALVQLVRLAPWENNTLPTIVQLSTFSWPYLDRETRLEIHPYLLKAANERASDVNKYLQLTGQLAAFCRDIVAGEAVNLPCK